MFTMQLYDIVEHCVSFGLLKSQICILVVLLEAALLLKTQISVVAKSILLLFGAL